MEDAEMDSVCSPVYTLCLQKSEEMNPISSVRHNKCGLPFIPLPMNSRNESWNSKRLSIIWAGWYSWFLFWSWQTDRQTVGTCPVKQVWDGYADNEVEAVWVFFPSLPCVIKYKRSHNLFVLSSLKFHAAIAPRSCQNHNNLIYFPFWKGTLFLTSHCWTWLLIFKPKHTCTQNYILQWANIALIQITLYLWVEVHYIHQKEGVFCCFLFLNHILKRSYVKHSCEKNGGFFLFFISLPPHLFL